MPETTAGTVEARPRPVHIRGYTPKGSVDIVSTHNELVAEVFGHSRTKAYDRAEEYCEAINSYDATATQLAAMREALRGTSQRNLVGWGPCWCEKNPSSANIVDHQTTCSAARAALLSQEEADG